MSAPHTGDSFHLRSWRFGAAAGVVAALGVATMCLAIATGLPLLVVPLSIITVGGVGVIAFCATHARPRSPQSGRSGDV
jgi:hypothetical protein